MSNNFYDSLSPALREVLDKTDLAEVAKQIDAELAKEQAQAYSEKMNAKEAVENFKSEYTKAKQISEYDLSNVQRTGKNCKEHTSWLDEFRAKLDSLSKEEFQKIFDEYAIRFKEEPVSRGLGKAEEFIKNNTKDCSNEIDQLGADIAAFSEYHPWITPDQAMIAVEIAKEEVIEKVCEFLENELCCYINAREFTIEHQRLENDLKQAINERKRK